MNGQWSISFIYRAKNIKMIFISPDFLTFSINHTDFLYIKYLHVSIMDCIFANQNIVVIQFQKSILTLFFLLHSTNVMKMKKGCLSDFLAKNRIC